jgi:rubrerythrin
MRAESRAEPQAAEPLADSRCIVVTDSNRLPCDLCGHPMEPEHAHYKCPSCGYIMPCCGW